MAKSNLLKEAIADAKAVRETAIANAKIALEEAFTPRLQSILSQKLQQEIEEGDDESEEIEENEVVEETETVEEAEVTEDEDKEEGEESTETVSEEEEAEVEETVSEEESSEEAEEVSEEEEAEEEVEAEEEAEEEIAEEGEESEEESDEDELDLEAIIKELEEELDDEETEEVSDIASDEIESHEEEHHEGEESEEDEITEEGEEEAEEVEESEVNLLNAKLLYTNKLFRSYDLNNDQKMKVVETLDRTKNVREVKLVFSTLAESLKIGGTSRKTKQTAKLTESFASKAVASTAPSKEVITESTNTMADRFKQLANIK